MNKAEMIEFIEGKLIEAFASLKAREEMETVWRGGTDETWRAVGCHLTKAQRLKDSAMHGRIAVKLRREVELFKAVRDTLNHPNAGTQRPGASDAPIATESAPPGSLK